MLDILPPEIIGQILSELPSVASIINVACTSRKLYNVVSANDYGIFKEFVQRAFPSIRTPPLWRDMARVLTSRSRAWDRRAFVARECCPPKDVENGPNWLSLSNKFGFVPVIDSYEDYAGTAISQKREVLAFGAAGRLRLRTTQSGRVEWRSLRTEHDHLPQFDIIDVKLLRPHQRNNLDDEIVIIRRANHEVTLVKSSSGEQDFTEIAKFEHRIPALSCVDVSDSQDPLLAMGSAQAMQLFPVFDTTMNSTSEMRPLAQVLDVKHKMRCMKFLNETTIAAGFQFAEGLGRAPVLIYDVSPTGLAQKPLVATQSLSSSGSSGRHAANVVTKLDNTSTLSGRPGQVFLSGWTDGVARLHDLRTPEQSVSEYIDDVDDGQIMSILPFGHERFFAGSHQNACLKVFDLRMSGAKMYSYLNAPTPRAQRAVHDNHAPVPSKPKALLGVSRDINIFLALTVNRGGSLWQPLPRRNLARLPRYRGSIYSLASPSPSSPTVYAGIENHVIQLDFISTDDIKLRKSRDPKDNNLGIIPIQPEEVLDLSCYERPRPGHVSTDSVLLRKQQSWNETSGDQDRNYDIAEEGWDERWRLGRSWKSRDNTNNASERRWQR